ncbi:MAG: hypothetical protein RL022_519 [Chloroflexota bacterium]|jgi:hypothetical protein
MQVTIGQRLTGVRLRDQAGDRSYRYELLERHRTQAT